VKKYQTNSEFVAELMDFSSKGALMHLFIMQAIEQFAKSVVEIGKEELEALMKDHIVDGGAWYDTAEEVLTRIQQHREGNK
jgi:hypothetical protein